MVNFSECPAVPEIATVERIAQMDFDAWTVGPDVRPPPTAAEWASLASPHLVTLGIAYRLMFKSKSALVEMVAKEDLGLWERVVNDLIQTREWLQMVHDVTRAAETRMMVALANLPEAHPAAPGGR